MSRRTVAGVAAAVIGTAVVVLLVMQLNAPSIVPAHLLRYRLGDTDQQIVVTVARGQCEKVKDARVQEDASSVRVTVLLEQSRATCTLNIVFEQLRFTLASPLAGRAVSNPEGSSLPAETP